MADLTLPQTNTPISGATRVYTAGDGQDINVVLVALGLPVPSVKQINTQWCTFACAESLSSFYCGSTSQTTYANTFYAANSIPANSNVAVSFSEFAESAMKFSVLGCDDNIATIGQITGSLLTGDPVFTRVDFGPGGHAIIITGITIYSDGTADLNYMNPDPNKDAYSKMSYQDYVKDQSGSGFLPEAYSIEGMKY